MLLEFFLFVEHCEAWGKAVRSRGSASNTASLLRPNTSVGPVKSFHSPCVSVHHCPAVMDWWGNDDELNEWEKLWKLECYVARYCIRNSHESTAGNYLAGKIKPCWPEKKSVKNTRQHGIKNRPHVLTINKAGRMRRERLIQAFWERS